MNVFNDMVKIFKQIRGRENLFGYESTLANQFYLTYCLISEIYQCREFHKHTKLIWFTCQFSILMICISSTLLYLLYGDKNDLMAMFYTAFIIMIGIFLLVVFGYISGFRYRNDLHIAIQTADYIVTKRISINIYRIQNNAMDFGKLITNISLFSFITHTAFSLCCITNVIFFYEEEKVKDYTYYVCYLPKLDQYGSYTLFLIFNTTALTFGISIFISLTMIAFMFVFCTFIYHDELQQIINDLNSLSSDSSVIMKSYKNIKPRFELVLVKCVRDIQDIIKMVKYFRRFYEAIAGITLSNVLFFEITHALIFISSDYPIAVRIKEGSIFLATILWVFVICWMGEKLNESTETLSFAVYSTPWYLSTSVRKDVLILLSQTRMSVARKALGTYPLSFSTFLRYMHVILSTTNILRKFTSK
ncbi:uncharacterized protein LOC135840439 [Planococcus citri]|uniref:uncharacterized protein LOC135840439 n=1 Tax=Planococcus citri TaxID=170843 RepID=UPI0031F9C26B